MNRTLSTKIVESLNRRGFILYDDVMTEIECGDDDFANLLQENMNLLQAAGYTGGELNGWSSSFRYPMVYAYGVVNGDWYWPEQDKNDQLIDSYVFAINDMLKESNLTVIQLRSLMLKLKFICDCGYKNLLLPQQLSTINPSTCLHQITGKCTACGMTGVKAEGAVQAF